MTADRNRDAARQHSYTIFVRFTATLLIGGGLWLVYRWGASGESFLFFFVLGERYRDLFWVVVIGGFAGGLAGRAQLEWHEESHWTLSVAVAAAMMVAAFGLFVVMVRSFGSS